MSDDEQPIERGGVTRRRILGIGAAAAGAVAAGSLLPAQDAAATADGPDSLTDTFPAAPANSTLATTLQHGAPGAGGYRHVVTAAGEPTLLRDELSDGATRGAGSRNALAAFTQLTDMHILDAQSPARVEFLDRFNDPGNPLASSSPFSSAYRPWEMLTAHVAEAMVQSLNSLGGAPVTGRPIDFTISTGDNADNTQYNELRWHIGLLDGGPIRPDSGNPNKWEGIGDKADYDTSYWHPDGAPLLSKPDNYRARYGYPTAPGLLDACRQAFTATGINTPWYSVFGNHDGLVQGTVPSLGVIGAVATGALKVTGLPLGIDVAALLARLGAGDATALAALLTLGPAKLVTPDKNRRMLTQKQTVAEHFNTSGTPVGHGYTPQNLTDGTAYYSFNAPDPTGPVHCISLDTVNLNGYSDGSITTKQLAWLTQELMANSARYLDASGQWVTGNGADKLIMIFSHHTVATMGNVIGLDRVNGTTVRDLLLRFPNVVAWVNGHTHHNDVAPHGRPVGTAVGGGFWEINTASHVDWPQQSRVVELVDNGDGTLSIFGTIVDHAAPPGWPTHPSTPLELAALARELAMNDPQRDAETAVRDGKRGTLTDRNVELLMRKPF
jgi:metallophosphoesterase (TIGR03767 family)